LPQGVNIDDVIYGQLGPNAPVEAYARVIGGLLAIDVGTWTRRKILQHVGTDIFRAIDPQHWVKKAREALAANPDARFVIPDLRFPNEADIVREFGGDVVLIERLGGGGKTTEHAGHASEQAWRSIEPTYTYQISYGLDHVAAAARDYAHAVGLILDEPGTPVRVSFEQRELASGEKVQTSQISYIRKRGPAA
jgi:deoxynucleotide monophosphate kinase-like protein